MAPKMVIKRDAEIRCDKMAEAIVNNDNKSFWKQPKSGFVCLLFFFFFFLGKL